MRVPHQFITIIAFASAFLCWPLAGTGAEPLRSPVDTVRAIAGRWTANAAAQWLNGTVDRFSCIITHFNDADHRYRHTWRCEKDGIKIELAVAVQQAGEKLSGTWEEKTYGLSGTFDGQTTATGWIIVGRNRFGFAGIMLAQDGCRATVEVIPSEQIKKVVAKMVKC